MSSEGTESTRTLEFLAWLEVNKKPVAIGLAAALLIGSAVATVQWMGRERQRRANSALLALQLRPRVNSDAPGPTASDYQELAAEHAGTAAAARAQLLAAERLFREANYAEAQQAFEEAQGQLKDEGLKATAAYGVAASLEALGRADAAEQAYQRVVLEHATAAVATQAQLALAGLYEQKGELARALQSYSELTNVVGSPWSSQASERRKELLLEHPELAPAESEPASVLTHTNTPTLGATNVFAPDDVLQAVTNGLPGQ